MRHPNIIFLIQDQMQQRVIYEESGCIMPNLRGLMEDGITFERAYTCNGICSPSRASLLTGTLPHVHGMIDCTHTVPPYRAEFDAGLDTITQALKDGGYRVSYYGKWHVERSHQLERFGISHYETEMKIPSFPVTMEERLMMRTEGYGDRLVCGVFRENSEHTEEHYIYGKAMEEIEACRESGESFCTFISTYAPHDPYVVPREIYSLYEGREMKLPESFGDEMRDKPGIYRRMRSVFQGFSEEDYRKAMRCYYSYCTLVDNQIGRLTAYLKERGIYEDTLIVCTADHGDMMGAHGMMMKSVEPFEEVYRIPLVMKLPGSSCRGSRARFYIGNCEIGPTVLELAGCRPLQGAYAAKSAAAKLREKKPDRGMAYAEFFGQRYEYTQRIVWKDDWKYVFNAFDEDELYDLAGDPKEMKNRAADPDCLEKKRELCQCMWEKMKETDDATLLDAEYYLMRFAPVGPGKKKQKRNYTVYNKNF